jgi:hypothetical protein
MDASELCQQLLDHVVRELPEEREAALGLAALLTFHPTEVRLFVVEVMALLMRHRCPLPEHLVPEVSRRITGLAAVEHP